METYNGVSYMNDADSLYEETDIQVIASVLLRSDLPLRCRGLVRKDMG